MKAFSPPHMAPAASRIPDAQKYRLAFPPRPLKAKEKRLLLNIFLEKDGNLRTGWAQHFSMKKAMLPSLYLPECLAAVILYMNST